MLRRLRGRSLAGAALHRVFRAERASPWWFSSRPAPVGPGGRFDLPPPDGSCYAATSLAGAVLEAFQEHSRGVLPDVELQARRRAECTAPASAPAAAVLNAAAARSAGVTAALWAGSDRALTQRWAAALHRVGWLAISPQLPVVPLATAFPRPARRGATRRRGSAR